MTELMRLPSEKTFADEIEALRGVDGEHPPGWQMTPRAVVTFLMGGQAPDGTTISQKYLGNQRLIETAVATLATDRALLLLGIPGTGKSWVAEHITAAICDDSQRLIQCTAGTDENHLRYGWNYAHLLAHGPSEEALVRSPMMTGMAEGRIVRLEELTRMGSDVQDTLITILSEKTLPIPELDTAVNANRGFNVLATANNKDKGVSEMSAALKRRFNVVVLPLPDDPAVEAAIIRKRVKDIGIGLQLPEVAPADAEIERVVTLFRELREGKTLDGKLALKRPSGTLSVGEAISVMIGAWAQAAHFGDGTIDATALSANLVGAIVKDPLQDRVVLQEYLETVVRGRKGWRDLYGAIRNVI